MKIARFSTIGFIMAVFVGFAIDKSKVESIMKTQLRFATSRL